MTTPAIVIIRRAALTIVVAAAVAGFTFLFVHLANRSPQARAKSHTTAFLVQLPDGSRVPCVTYRGRSITCGWEQTR